MTSISLSEEMTKYRTILNEAWGKEMHTPASKKGMFKGKTKEELRSELSAAKKRSKAHHDAGTKEPESLKTKIKELEFALRAKNRFGKVNEDEQAGEEAICKDCKKKKTGCICEGKTAKHEKTCKKCKKSDKDCMCESIKTPGPFAKNGSFSKRLA